MNFLGRFAVLTLFIFGTSAPVYALPTQTDDCLAWTYDLWGNKQCLFGWGSGGIDYGYGGSNASSTKCRLIDCPEICCKRWPNGILGSESCYATPKTCATKSKVGDDCTCNSGHKPMPGC